MNDEDAQFASYVRLFLDGLRRELNKKNVQTLTANKAIEFLGKKDPTALHRALGHAASETLGPSIPETRLGDRIFAYRRFVLRLLRMPTTKSYFHDVLFKIKTTDEILNPLRVFISDKEFSKIYIKATVGDQYSIPTIDVIRSAEELDDYNFPKTCVVKPTHGYGEIVFRRDNSPLDLSELKKWFQMNFYQFSREANYKTLKPKIIIEPFFEGLEKATDYKFFCVNGQPKVAFVNGYKNGVKSRQYFDIGWNALPFVEKNIPRLEEEVPRPANFPEMIDLAKELSAPFNFIRVDLYSDGKTCKVGELTNCHAAGDRPFTPREDHLAFSNLLFDED